MPEPLSALYATPCPERAILLGKGPSVEQFDAADFPGTVIFGINETVEMHDCTHNIYLDPWFGDLNLGKSVPIRPFVYKKNHDGRGYIFNHYNSRDIPRTLIGKTAPCALGILGHWGVRQVLMVGFDGFDTGEKVYAPHLHLRRGVHNLMLERINAMISKAFAQFGFVVRFWHRGERFIDSPEPLDRFHWYREQYSGLYSSRANAGYGSSCHGKPYLNEILDLLSHRDVLVDVGCGNNQFSELLINAGNEQRKTIRCYGIDVVPTVRVPEGVEFVNAPSWNLCLPTKPDAITSFDVLEHLREDEIDPTLAHWASLKPKFTFNTVSTRRSSERQQLPHGAPAHLTVKGADWWSRTFQKHWKTVDVRQETRGRIVVKAFP